MGLKKRRGITLLITLSIIATMLALIGVLFGYLETARQQAISKSAVLQTALLRENLQPLLQRYLKKPSTETLQQFYRLPFSLSDEKGTFTLMLRCSPLLNRIPISWLGKENDPTFQKAYQLARELFDDLAERAELKDPFTLYEMIRGSLQGETPRFGEKEWLKGNTALLGPHVFKRLLDDYRFAADDPNVYKVQWNEYFLMNTFPVKPKQLDKDFLSPALLAYLFQQDPKYIRNNYQPGRLQDFLLENGLAGEMQPYDWLFAKKAPVAMECTAHYSFREREYNFAFDYRNGRIEHFEHQAR